MISLSLHSHRGGCEVGSARAHARERTTTLSSVKLLPPPRLFIGLLFFIASRGVAHLAGTTTLVIGVKLEGDNTVLHDPEVCLDIRLAEIDQVAVDLLAPGLGGCGNFIQLLPGLLGQAVGV